MSSIQTKIYDLHHKLKHKLSLEDGIIKIIVTTNEQPGTFKSKFPWKDDALRDVVVLPQGLRRRPKNELVAIGSSTPTG